jgi:hypothetical protein
MYLSREKEHYERVGGAFEHANEDSSLIFLAKIIEREHSIAS